QLDEGVTLFLKQQNKNLEYVPDKNERVYLRENSNISTGGDSLDYKKRNIAKDVLQLLGF
ncbi:MAG: hypothetical protein RR427_11655, partial [Cellulosilyticaceae bacterium]